MTRLVKQYKTKEGNEEFAFEIGRAKQEDRRYPTYTFLRYPKSAPGDAVLHEFSGSIYLGKDPIVVSIRYGYLISVEMEVVTPTPPADTPAESSAPFTPSVTPASLPAPFGQGLFTFQQIEQQKLDLKERIVRVEIGQLLGEGEDVGNNLLRFIAKDTSSSATPYGQLAFPRDGLEKTGLQQKGKGPLVVYVRVHLVSTKAAAICEVVGTKFSPDAQGSHYEW